MTAQQIVDEVRAKLLANPDKVEQRRRMVARLAAARREWPGLPRGVWLPRHPDAVLTMDQSRMLEAGVHLRLKLLVLGTHVADVELTPDDVFELAARPLDGLKPFDRRLRWTKDGIDSAEINGFIESCLRSRAGRTSELQVQLQLVRLLANSEARSRKLEALRNLQPVLPFGFPTEIATAITRDGNAGTGNMDILCRTRSGSRHELVVMELKAPTIESRDVAGAFAQAIRYAAALTFEANGFDGTTDDHQEASHDYWQVFAPQADGKSRRPLFAHAAVVLPSSVADAAMTELRTLMLEISPPRVLGREIGVGVLLYDASRTDKVWTLDEASLRWEGPWSPGALGKG